MKSPGNTAPFVFTREVKAPLDAVWKAWTEEDQLRQWWGPKGADIISFSNDFRVGGEFRFHHQFQGTDIRGVHVYREIAAPNRMVFIGSFCDAAGEIGRNPFEDDWPLRITETVEFAEHDGHTKVRITWVPIDPSEIEREAYNKELQECARGWSGLFERLEELLAAR